MAADPAVETLRYTYRLRLGVQAERALLDEWARCRWVWNQAVHQQRTGNKPTLCRLAKMLTESRRTLGWLRDGARRPQAQTLRSYAAALDRSYRIAGCGRPAYKSRKRDLPSLEYLRGDYAIRGGRLILAKGISFPVVWSRDLPSSPSSLRVCQDSLGHWYVSFVVSREVVASPPPDGAIGIDWGVIATATTTDPAYDLPYGGRRARCAAELAKAQRKMSRRYRHGSPPSRGYQRAKRQAAKLHKKAARQNAHDSRMWALRVASNHQMIAVEDFKPKFLAKTAMARKAADAAIGAAKRELIERGRRMGRDVVLVPTAFTTMTCSECGTRAKERLGLGERIFRCTTCGYTDGRDRNAARVILATAENVRAGADDIRRPKASAGGRGLSQEARDRGGSKKACARIEGGFNRGLGEETENA